MDSEYQVGVFAKPGAIYNSFIRVSNAAADKKYSEKDVRGAAIKVLLPGDGDYTLATFQDHGIRSNLGQIGQDFLLITGPAVFVDRIQTVKDLLVFIGNNKKPQRVAQESRQSAKGFLLNASEFIKKKLAMTYFFFKRRKEDGFVLMRNASKANVKVNNAFEPVYNSGSIYAFGEKAVARYRLLQTSCPDIGTSNIRKQLASAYHWHRSADYLSQQLPEMIKADAPDICMNLEIQVSFDKQSAVVERPHIAWEDTPSIPAAMIRISPPKIPECYPRRNAITCRSDHGIVCSSTVRWVA
ncbi:MAG: hypothetical protein F3745_04760 [Nitrospinae bacterium]|nr:hypothetical protein [Nitrospinota bacterium]